MGRGLRALQNIRLIDLSVPISEAIAEPSPPKIHYIDHTHAATELAQVANTLIRHASGNATDPPVITEDAFPDRLGLANEDLQLDSHSGTHMDAPWHFGPLCENLPAKTIDQIPLEWCFRPGVVLDLRHKKPGDMIQPSDLDEALKCIDYQLEAGDIVLLMTGADKHLQKKDYFSAHPGMGREATLWLINQGIKMIGIDGWGFDRPAGAMLHDYLETHHHDALLPAHMVGREREYCHIEKMANLDKIPTPYGFWVSCFPVKIERGSAGWIRAVALIEEDPYDATGT
jgi:kynurenine formamidase